MLTVFSQAKFARVLPEFPSQEEQVTEEEMVPLVAIATRAAKYEENMLAAGGEKRRRVSN